MCLIGFSLDRAAGTLVLAANRDEYFERATQSAHWWADEPGIFAGRDLQANGTWLGFHQRGRLAALTNYRDGGASSVRSRGELVTAALNKAEPADQLVERLGASINQYAGCSLLVFDWNPDAMQSRPQIHSWCVSNRDEKAVRPIDSGVFALSNGLFDEPWPKSERIKRTFEDLKSLPKSDHDQTLLGALTDHQIPNIGTMPDTGIGTQREAELAPAFIRTHSLGSGYGTLSSAIIRIEPNSPTQFDEWTWNHGEQNHGKQNNSDVVKLRTHRRMTLRAGA